jgi:nitrite reductase/ring-hydroxylating ferredoxin subunit/uncharacterized membrane protein
MRGAWEPVEVAVDLLGRDERLDPPATAISGLIEQLLPTGPARDFLHGVWLGHPLHPMLTDLPIGSWTSAMVLDVFGGGSGARAARCLVGFGCLSALPTIASGAADWSRLDAADQRVGLVHAAANSVALGLYTWSWLERRRGRRGRGVAISFVAAAAATAGGLLGGHLAFRRSVGSNRAIDIEPPAEWAETSATASSLPHIDVLSVEGVDVLVDAEINGGIAARCSHAGGPLADGAIEGAGRERCVVCPWHGSTFRLSDGAVVHGPATSPQPAYEARRAEGRWQVRARRG